MDGGSEITRGLHRFSVQDYHRMGEAGVFHDARVELIDGTIIDMAPIGTARLWTVTRLNRLFAPLMVTRRANVSVQDSIRLNNQCEPEPDVTLLSWTADETFHPGPTDILLVVEVADTSLEKDQSTKAQCYAAAGIRDYWIVNLIDRVVEVHRNPSPDGYRQKTSHSSGPLPLLALADFTITVEEILPTAHP